MDNQQLVNLFQRKIAGTLNPEELVEFGRLIEDAGLQGQWEQLIDQLLQNVPGLSLPEENAQATLEAIFRADLAPVVPMNRRRNWRRIAVAAAVFFVIGISSYFLLLDKVPAKGDQVITDEPADVPPPFTNRATIKLAGGQTIFLDSAVSGTLTMQQQVRLTKLADGKIAYSGSATELVYNTLTNPRGSKVIDMTLADGSHVWLNAGSSLTYPVAFIGNERKVQVSGEAYFEVAHDKARPFYVSKGDLTVQVLGTHFNVNAYDDDSDIKVTLLEGSISINSIRIKPGQQARVSSGVEVIDDVDMEQVMAWKNGEFQFGDKSDIGTIMRQVARWYNIEVQYKDTIAVHIGGSISRNVNVSQVLQMLQKTGAVKFNLQGNKVIVMR